MKKIFFVSFLFSTIISFGQKPNELPISFRLAPPEDPAYTIGKCECPKGQSPVGASVTWDIATCESGCESGLGFACSAKGVILCDKGTLVICDPGVGCMVGLKSGSNRNMTASYTFYDNNTLKLTFKNAIPAVERGKKDFHVGNVMIIPLPPGMLIDGILYKEFQVKKGVYQVDYSDGEFGSVTVPVQLR